MKTRILFAVLMGFVATAIVSFTLVSVNIGFSEKFTSQWLKSWFIGYLVITPTILFIGPGLQNFVNKRMK